MGNNGPHDIQTLIIFAAVVAWTFQVLRYVLEDKLDLDVIISLWILRPLEFLIAIAIFPCALIVVTVIIYLRVALLMWQLSCCITRQLTQSNFLRAVAYLLTEVAIFLVIDSIVASLVRAVLRCLK